MKLPAPRWVCLQLLQACNLRCTLCYEWGLTGAYKDAGRTPMLSFDVVERIVQDLAPYRPHYDLFGGEPLLHPRIADVLHAIKRAGSTLHIVTNGTTLEEHAELLASAPVDRVWISIDGPERINDLQRGPGTFSRITRGVAALRAARERQGGSLPELGASLAVTPLNHAHIAETFLEAIDWRAFDQASIEYQSFITADQLQAYQRILNDRFGRDGVRHAAAFVRDPAELSSIDAEQVERQIDRVRAAWSAEGKRVLTKPLTTTAENTRAYFSARIEALADYHPRCLFPWLYAEVAATGDVTPCHAFYDLTFGNVREQSLLEIWRSERFEQARAFFASSLMPVCAACCLYHTKPDVPARRASPAEA
jgi:radical SAM protein with 4Fe4S-binding SPASM domain